MALTDNDAAILDEEDGEPEDDEGERPHEQHEVRQVGDHDEHKLEQDAPGTVNIFVLPSGVNDNNGRGKRHSKICCLHTS